MADQEFSSEQYVTFTLGEEGFAIDVAKAREILDTAPITNVPQTPDFMLGVINLRGNVVPVVDLRLKFGMPSIERTVDTCIIVMELDVDGETTVIGTQVDAVREVLELDAGQIEPPPRLGTKLKTEFIKGMGKVGDDFLIILDINRIFTADELAVVQQTGDSPSSPVPEEEVSS